MKKIYLVIGLIENETENVFLKRKSMDCAEVTLKFVDLKLAKLLIIFFLVSKQFIDLLRITYDRKKNCCILRMFSTPKAVRFPGLNEQLETLANIQPSWPYAYQ